MIAVDGLAVDDLASLVKLCPSLSRLMATGLLCSFSNRLLTSSQAVWAELLTGEPWHKNGCVGFATVKRSLNVPVVCSERDLFAAERLLRQGADDLPAVVVNIPLLRPAPDRIWLSDGSLPLNRIVSPEKLLLEQEFAQYIARPFTSICGSGAAANQELAEASLLSEEKRLACVSSLFRRHDWSKFIYRLTVFDQLAHLLGQNFIEATDLAIFEILKNFISSLDDFFKLVLSQVDVDVFLVSTYSHAPCRGVLNLNEILRESGLLELAGLATDDRDQTGRVRSRAALAGAQVDAFALSSMEGRLMMPATQAASPIQGCVFINRTALFVDGCVKDEAYPAVRSAVLACLRDRLSKFDRTVSIVERPETSAVSSRPLPEFMVLLKGVEFHNMHERGGKGYNVPRTTHSPAGFALIPKTLVTSPVLELSQFQDVFNASGSSIN